MDAAGHAVMSCSVRRCEKGVKQLAGEGLPAIADLCLAPGITLNIVTLQDCNCKAFWRETRSAFLEAVAGLRLIAKPSLPGFS